MFNQYTSTHCQHQIPAISCSICNSVQKQVYSQTETRIKNYEEQLKEYRKIVVEQEKKMVELTTELAYANQTIENHYYEEPIKEQYLYVYNHTNEGKTYISPTFIHETYGWHYMGKVRVEK